MLVLARSRDQSIIIGDDIKITVVEVRGNKVRLGIDAPQGVTVHREEIYRQIKEAERGAAAPQAMPPGEAGPTSPQGVIAEVNHRDAPS